MVRCKDEIVSNFFTNKKGKIQYNNKCLHCRNDCKQSFRATIVCCPKYKDRQSK